MTIMSGIGSWLMAMPRGLSGSILPSMVVIRLALTALCTATADTPRCAAYSACVSGAAPAVSVVALLLYVGCYQVGGPFAFVNERGKGGEEGEGGWGQAGRRRGRR